MTQWKDATNEQPATMHQTGYGDVRPYVLCYARWQEPSEYFIASYDPDSQEWSLAGNDWPVDVEWWTELPEVPETAV